VRAAIAELHFAAINLPKVDFDEDHESETVPKEKWEDIRQRFSNLLVEGYWDVFDPLKEEEPVFNPLSDDLADIYSHIREDLSLYEAGYIYEAVWQWRFNYLIHWGKHLTSAQRALHSYFINTEEKE
jgi:hypothetical protein